MRCLFWWLFCCFSSKYFYLFQPFYSIFFMTAFFAHIFFLSSLFSSMFLPTYSYIHFLYTSFNPFFMSPAKGEGSSHHKGKEAIVDKLFVEVERGKQAPHFELNRFEDKEATHDPNSECPPFIDQWYDTYLHFLVVANDYLPPPLGHVWQSLEWCDFDISWAMLPSFILDLAIHHGETSPILILFKFGSGTLLDWK